MSTDERIHVHPAPVRLWHWINAACFLVLILTGLRIRFAESLSFLSLERAVSLHNTAGLLLLADYLIWLFYYFSEGRIKIYFPHLRGFSAEAVKQVRFYGHGLFRGEANPHVMSPENKFNPLQQNAYLSIMFLLLPAQIASGFFLWKIKGFENYIGLLGGIRVVATIHVFFFFFFSAFLLVHCYLATLGHTPLAHFKAMITGHEEHPGETAHH